MSLQKIAPAVRPPENSPVYRFPAIAAVPIRSKNPADEEISSVGASKQWILPPRRKPGRKPGHGGAKSENSSQEKVALDRLKAENENLQKKIRELEEKLHQYENKEHKEHKHEHSNTSIQNGMSVQLDNNCGFCDSESNCVCAALEIKVPKHSQSKAAEVPKLTEVSGTPIHPEQLLAQYDSFTPQKAVPLKRQPTLRAMSPFKRFKKVADLETDVNELSANSDRGTPDSATYSLEPSTPGRLDPCGFCSNDTPCLCADTKKRHESHFDTHSRSSSLSTSILHAGEAESTQSMTTANHRSTSTPASNGWPQISDRRHVPGTCEQCQNDPLSTLFCTSLSSRPAQRPINPMTVSCTHAYQAISRHNKFAKTDLGYIINNLSSHDGQVEVDSISRTLREMNDV